MKYEITKEQINELLKESDFAKLMFPKWIPEAFETKLESCMWYNYKGSIFFITSFDEENHAYGYGYSNRNSGWVHFTDHKGARCICNKMAVKYIIPATESEVFEALKKEAVKRGFVNGVKFKTAKTEIELKGAGGLVHYPNENGIYFCNGGSVFSSGKWAEIIKEKTLSKSEAEAKLNGLINDGYEYKIELWENY